MNNLRRKFELFCYKNRDKGIPNLMLYICLGNAVVYVLSSILGNTSLYSLLVFYRPLILKGQIWRLVSYPLTMYNGNILFMFISLLCYYSLGTVMERFWGTFKFNLFYLSGIVLMDVYSMIFGCQADVYYLNLSLLLSFATINPSAVFFLYFIPVKAWLLALFDMVLILVGVVTSPFPYSMFPIIALLNYFLFFGSSVLNLLPLSWRRKLSGITGKKPQPAAPKVIRFRGAPAQQAPQKPNYNHRCTVCGRTDVSDPNLEFRYCSRCKGYYCYCEDHISNHAHIQ